MEFILRNRNYSGRLCVACRIRSVGVLCETEGASGTYAYLLQLLVERLRYSHRAWCLGLLCFRHRLAIDGGRVIQ